MRSTSLSPRFLARYSGRTRDADRHDLRSFFQWTTDVGLVLLGLTGQRVSEARGTNIEDLGFERGHRTLKILGKAPSLR